MTRYEDIAHRWEPSRDPARKRKGLLRRTLLREPANFYLDASLERHLGYHAATAVKRSMYRKLEAPARLGVAVALLTLPLYLLHGPLTGHAPLLALAILMFGYADTITRRERSRSLQGADVFCFLGSRKSRRILRRNLDKIPGRAVAESPYGDILITAVDVDRELSAEMRILADGYEGSIAELLVTTRLLRT